MELKFVVDSTNTEALRFSLEDLTIKPLLGTINVSLGFSAPANMMVNYDPVVRLEFHGEPDRLVAMSGYKVYGRSPFVLYYDKVRKSILKVNDVSSLIGSDGMLLCKPKDIIDFASITYMVGKGNIGTIDQVQTVSPDTELPMLDNEPVLNNGTLYTLPLPSLTLSYGTGNAGFMAGDTYREEGFISGRLILDITDGITGVAPIHSLSHDGVNVTFHQVNSTEDGGANSGNVTGNGSRKIFIMV